MPTVSDYIRAHTLESCGLIRPRTRNELAAALAAWRDPNFAVLRERYLLAGELRYGSTGLRPGYLRRALHSVAQYHGTRNREHLIDLANFAELEWVCPMREGTYFRGTDRA